MSNPFAVQHDPLFVHPKKLIRPTSRTSLPIAFSLAVLLAGCGGGGGGGNGGSSNTGAGEFTQTNLVSNSATISATLTDPNLVNPWGVSLSPNGPFWVSDAATGVSSTYSINGTGSSLTVQNAGLTPTIPLGSVQPNPPYTKAPVTGQVYNGGGGFLVGGFPAFFLFDSEDGTISGWYTGSSAVKAVDNSASGAIYTGLAINTNAGASYIYAANFHSGAVETYDSTFAPQAFSFTDPNLPTGYAPFGIQSIGSQVFVTFAPQNGTKTFPTPGANAGIVDVFSPAGAFVKRLITGGPLNAPWGLAQAPSGFGKLGGALLVGNLGDGTINAFNISTGAFIGALQGTNGQPIVIDGLWGLIFGNGNGGGSTKALYFTSGPSFYSQGLFGAITPGTAAYARPKGTG